MAENQPRELALSAAFVKLANTLTAEYDMVDLLHVLVEECVALLGAEAGALLLVDSIGNLQLVASTGDDANLVEASQLGAGAGPCLDCFDSGVAVSVGDVGKDGARWPDFQAAVTGQGFRSVHATPVRLRGNIIGVLGLFGTQPGELSDSDAGLAQALADVAAVGIMQERIVREPLAVAEQLQRALNTRILIEQASGVLSEANSIDTGEAFRAMRGYARNNNLSLHVVAERIVNRTIHLPAYESAPSASAPH